MDVRFPSVGLHQSADGAHLLYKREVQIGNRKAVVTLRFSKNSGITEAAAKSKMEESIAKLTTLAKDLRLGEEGLEKIFISQGEVRGFWNEAEGGHQVAENFTEKLQAKKEHASNGDKAGIEQQLEVIQTATQAFTQLFPLTEAGAISSDIQIEESAPSLVSTPKTTTDIQATFATAQTKAKKLLDGLDSSENAKFIVLLGTYEKLMNALDTTKDLNGIGSIRTELKELAQLKTSSNINQDRQFNELLIQLDTMATSYNEIVARRKQLEIDSPQSSEIEKLKASEGEMRSKIMEYNTKMGQRNLTTNRGTIDQSHVMDFASVVEKKLSLMEQKLKLSGSEKKSDKEKLKKIEKELQKAPTSKTMKEEADNIRRNLVKPPTLVSVDQAKHLHESRPNLKWGENFLNVALTTPLNWTKVQTAFIKESRAGFMHVAVTVNEPLHIDEGGAPSGMLNKGDYRTKAINLFKTTSYIRSNGQPSRPQIAFRGGQFASREAAKIALKEILKTSQNGEVHINALLTPTAVTILKKDRGLLAAHKKHVLEAIEDLKREEDPSITMAVRKLEGQIAISNFGVNEGAVGEKNNGFLGLLKKLGLRPQYGWHTSIGDYSNDAAEKLNSSLYRKFKTVEDYLTTETSHFSPLSQIDPAFLDNLGAISEVGLEMQTIWNTNAYADARVGDNQFKLPSLWKVMDELLGVRCYTNCMSGKDRTGKVQDNAQEFLDEISMNTADHKLTLKKKFDSLQTQPPDDRWTAMEKILTSACFMPEDLDHIYRRFTEDPENLEKHIRSAIQEKVKNVKTALGTTSDPQQFMVKKTVSKGRTFTGGIQGISASDKVPVRPKGFATFSVTSMFDKSPNPSENAQREAYNRRLTQAGGSLKITQMNTGKPGFKVEGGNPLERFTAGFDRGYVLLKLREAHTEEEMRKGLKEWVGLDDLDPEAAKDFVKKMWEAGKLNTSSDTSKAERAWNIYLDNMEKHKMRSLFPTTNVKA